MFFLSSNSELTLRNSSDGLVFRDSEVYIGLENMSYVQCVSVHVLKHREIKFVVMVTHR